MKRLNQPMTATLINRAGRLEVYTRNWTDFCKERTSVSVHMQEWFYWSNAVTWCVTWKITKVINEEERTEDFDARKMEQFVQIEERGRKNWRWKKTRGDLACEESVSVWFRSKDEERESKTARKYSRKRLLGRLGVTWGGETTRPNAPCFSPLMI